MTRHPARRLLAAAAALVVLTPAVPVAADPLADDPPPSTWPDGETAAARPSGAANALRLWGKERTGTGLAIALTLRGSGGYPFTTPDRSSGGALTLGASDGWWGADRCPRSVIVVASDVAADALTASSLSDPTDGSSEPFLQRSAAADPLFDPIGGFARVDTEAAPILVTRAARAGATSLSPAARLAAQDLRRGGCSTARQAIVVGGPSAVPIEVEAELVSIGYDEVFRIAGEDRYATAASVARSLGTAPVPATSATCVDPRSDDGTTRRGFHANSVVEHRADAATCELLGRTVVLADGVTGTDALAAGWWTGYWQVPVLLHDGSDDLRPATAEALTTMEVEHLIVLGGPARISDTVVDDAIRLTGARVIRVAGADRYETSVDMARRFGGWWSTGRGTESSSGVICIAASSGDGDEARGWPDALAGGPLCGALDASASGIDAPDRALLPLTGDHPTTTGASADDQPLRRRDAVPILLVPYGSSSLPDVVDDFLVDLFEPADNWCTSIVATSECLLPGFALILGGPAAIADDAIEHVSARLSGGSNADAALAPASWTRPFHTGLDLTPVYGSPGTGDHRVCADRSAIGHARWLAAFAEPEAARLVSANDVFSDGRYVTDADGITRSRGISAPVCVRVGSAMSITTRAVGPAGRAGPVTTFAVGPDHRLSLSAPLTAPTPDAVAGTPSEDDASAGGPTTWTFTSTDPGVTIQAGPTPASLSTASITLTLTRGTDTGTVRGPDRFTASATFVTSLGTLNGVAEGEAILTGGVWEFRGRSTITPGSWAVSDAPVVGGFTASITTGSPGSSDDSISWRVDGLLSGSPG